MFTKKSLVLLGTENDMQKAVITLEKSGDLLSGRLRLYNFEKEPDGILSLGIYENGKVKKCGLVHFSSMLYTFKTDPAIGENFSCAVVNFVGAKVKPLLFGSTEENSNLQEVLGIMASDVLNQTKMSDVEKKLDELGIDYDEDEAAEIEKAIDHNMQETEICSADKCSNCNYRKCFFGETQEEEEKSKFIDDIQMQIDRIFETSPKESLLEEMIPASKWARVEFDGDGDYYILGLIYDEEGKIKYVCYGVPGIFQKTPPKNLSGYPVWFPLDREKPESFGYWLTYQDAGTGESIKAIVE